MTLFRKCFPSASEVAPLSSLCTEEVSPRWCSLSVSTFSDGKDSTFHVVMHVPLPSSCLFSSGDHAHVSSLLTTRVPAAFEVQTATTAANPKAPTFGRLYGASNKNSTLWRPWVIKFVALFPGTTHTRTYKVLCHFWDSARPHTLHTENKLGFL